MSVLPDHWKHTHPWRFAPQAWLYLGTAFTFGIAQAISALFLNFYLRALGLGSEWQGLVNALPAIALAVVGLPAAALARRISNARMLRFGTALGAVGALVLALGGNPATALLGTLIGGAGGAMIMVSSAPFLTNNSAPYQRVALFSAQMALMTGAGFLGNLLGGQGPGVFARLTGNGDDLAGLRAVLIASALVQVAGFLSTLLLRPDHGPAREGRSFSIQDKRTMARLVLPNALVGIGAGATIPFLNVFIEGKFDVPYASLGSLFAWTSLATAVTVLVQPMMVSRFGRLKTILFVQGGSLPFLALLGFAPALWMVVVALFTRGALMNAAGPVYSALAMDALPEQDRTMYAAVNSIVWNVTWAISTVVAGVVRRVLPFDTAFVALFAWTLAMYTLAVVAIYLVLYRPMRPAEREAAVVQDAVQASARKAG